MKTIGQFEFPESQQEGDDWVPAIRIVALHAKVLCRANTRIEGAWCAYCFPVPGLNHAHEEHLWKSEGAKLPEKWARALFPVFDELPYAY
jgi:hypothetical protein